MVYIGKESLLQFRGLRKSAELYSASERAQELDFDKKKFFKSIKMFSIQVLEFDSSVFVAAKCYNDPI